MATYTPEQISEFVIAHKDNPALIRQTLGAVGVTYDAMMQALAPLQRIVDAQDFEADGDGELVRTSSDAERQQAHDTMFALHEAGITVNPNDPRAVGAFINERGITDPNQALQLARELGSPVDNPEFVQATIQGFQGDQERLSKHNNQSQLGQFWDSARPLLTDAARFAAVSAGAYGAAYGLGSLASSAGLPAGETATGAESWMTEGFNSGLNIGEGGGLNLAEAGTMSDASSAAANTIVDSSYALGDATLADIASVTPEAGGGSSLLSSAASTLRSFAPSKETMADLKTIGTAGGILSGAAALYGVGKAVTTGAGSTSTTTQTTTAAPRTPEETRLIQLQIDSLERQAALEGEMTPVIQAQIREAQAELDRAETQRTTHDPATINRVITQAWNDPSLSMEDKQQALSGAMRQYGITASEVADATGVPVSTVSAFSGIPLTNTERNTVRQQEILDIQFDQLKQGTKATPEQADLIHRSIYGEGGNTPGGAYGTALTNIERFRTDTLRAINQEVAAASGLSLDSTPITAQHDRLAAEVVRQEGNLSNTMASTEANALLNYPLAAQGVSNATATTAGNLNMATQEFQNQLAQTAANNRYRLFANPMQTPAASTGAGTMALNLGRERTNLGTTSVTGTRGLGLTDYSQLLGGIGSVMRGASNLF